MKGVVVSADKTTPATKCLIVLSWWWALLCCRRETWYVAMEDLSSSCAENWCFVILKTWTHDVYLISHYLFFIFQHRIIRMYLLTVWSLSWSIRGLCSHSPVGWSPPHSRTSPGTVCRGAAPGPRRMLCARCCKGAQRLPGPAGWPRAPRSSRWGWDFCCRHTHT